MPEMRPKSLLNRLNTWPRVERRKEENDEDQTYQHMSMDGERNAPVHRRGVTGPGRRWKLFRWVGRGGRTLFVLKATGEILGTYIGKSSFNETFTPTKNHPPAGTFLNRALSEAVHQIQDELSHDVELGKMASS